MRRSGISTTVMVMVVALVLAIAFALSMGAFDDFRISLGGFFNSTHDAANDTSSGVIDDAIPSAGGSSPASKSISAGTVKVKA